MSFQDHWVSLQVWKLTNKKCQSIRFAQAGKKAQYSPLEEPRKKISKMLSVFICEPGN